MRLRSVSLLLAAVPLGLGAAVLGTTQVPAQSVDIDAVFNCAPDGPLGPQTPDECMEARELVLVNCTACHTFVPIVKAQKAEGAWNATLQAHRARMPEVGNDDYEKIAVFLKAHYNPDNEPPKLPPELEALGDIPQ